MQTVGQRIRGAAMLGALGLLAACGVQNLPLGPDPALVAQADAAFDELTVGDTKALLARMPEQFRGPTHERVVGMMHGILPSSKHDGADVIGWNFFTGTGGSRRTLALRYDYANGEHITAAAVFARKKDAEPWRMQGFNIKPSEPAEIDAPTLKPAKAPQAKPKPRSSKAPADS